MSDASTQRVLRKQLLLMRAATERAEMVGGLRAARRSVTFPKSAASGLALFKGLPLALSLIRRLPLLGSVLPLLLSGARRPLMRYGLLAAGSVLLAWKGYQWFADQSGRPEGQPSDADGW